MEEFIKNFADQFDDTDYSEFKPETDFHELDEWSSLIGLAVLNMIKKKYGKNVSPQQLKDTITISDLYNVVTGN